MTGPRRYAALEVAEFEERLGVEFPRWFVRHLVSTGVDRARFEFLLEDVVNDESLPALRDDFPYEVPPAKGAAVDPARPNAFVLRGALPIADCGCGSLEWLVVRGPLRGATVLTEGASIYQFVSRGDE